MSEAPGEGAALDPTVETEEAPSPVDQEAFDKAAADHALYVQERAEANLAAATAKVETAQRQVEEGQAAVEVATTQVEEATVAVEEAQAALPVEVPAEPETPVEGEAP